LEIFSAPPLFIAILIASRVFYTAFSVAEVEAPAYGWTIT
jgi:hypothetical protein